MRRRIAAAVDALVALLDQIDGDSDFEEDEPLEDDAPAEDVGDAEPSLGACGGTWNADTFNQSRWPHGAKDDREDESELLEDGADGEPTLGSTTAINQERAWAAPRGWPVDDGEPSLGWTAPGRGHPETAMRGYDDEREQNIGADEREHDDAERSGCGDMDGVMEQHGFGVSYAE
ncbi:MAG: hypothetical protein AB7F41_10630 [Methylocystis sp.]|uniref:hypothetical protein n=1 Tax=Methylocystis sp. TaxID=1911079 RepID=UPI003D0F9A35